MTTTPTSYEAGTTYHVPPGTLLLQRNIRDAKVDEDLLASVTAVGVLEPIVAVRTPDGDLLVRSGHRRTLAAVQAGTDTVPVYVTGVDDTAAEAEVDRIIRQRDENTHRTGLTTAEELGVVTQLAMFGLTVDEISKQARIPKKRVEVSIDAAASKLAAKAAAKWEDLTLDQVSAIAEFDHDPDAVKALVQAAHDGRFDHTVQQMRDDRDYKAGIARIRDELRVAGVTVIDRPDWNSKVVREDRLVDIRTGKNVTAKAHEKCPGRVGWAEGWNVQQLEAAFGCADAKKHGHRDKHSSTSKPAAADMTDEEREASKAERQLVIQNNRAWASAEAVRRRWLANFAKLKTPPKGAGAFLAVATSRDSSQFTYSTEPAKLTIEWLGLKGSTAGRFDLTAAVDGTTEARALHIALVHNLAVYEAELTKGSWRENGTTSRAGRYLRFLASCGYPLSEVEEYAISKRTV